MNLSIKPCQIFGNFENLNYKNFDFLNFIEIKNVLKSNNQLKKKDKNNISSVNIFYFTTIKKIFYCSDFEGKKEKEKKKKKQICNKIFLLLNKFILVIKKNSQLRVYSNYNKSFFYMFDGNYILAAIVLINKFC